MNIKVYRCLSTIRWQMNTFLIIYILGYICFKVKMQRLLIEEEEAIDSCSSLSRNFLSNLIGEGP